MIYQVLTQLVHPFLRYKNRVSTLHVGKCRVTHVPLGVTYIP